MQSVNGKKKIIFDCILVAVLLVIALSAFLIIRFTADDGNKVRVSVNGEIVAEYPLSEDGEYSVQGYNGGSNIFKIEGGKAFMIHGSCDENPGKKCTRQDAIPNELNIIVCRPNRVVLEVVE